MAPQYKLRYFNVTALAEPTRFLFSYGGIEFEDERWEREDWPSIKPTMPFGQAPVLEVNGKAINQSMAMARYAAKLVKLAGNDDLEALQIDSMVDNINDLRTKIAQYSYEADEELKEKKREPLFNETIPFYMEKFDAIAKENNGYFANGKLSWADMYFTALLDYLEYMTKTDLVEKYPNVKAVRDNVLALPAIKKWIAKRPKTEL